MGAESVAYHKATVFGRGDDYPRQALEYYASRGETPLLWGGSGAESLGLAGAVTDGQYEAIYGPGGAKHPKSSQRLVLAKRPGMELVISAHKSVAELGVIGRAEDMHAIMDAERDATLAYLDQVTRSSGGRRGRTAAVTRTGGLIYAHTRHATSRAGDPCPHDHVLIANLVEMLDQRGGWKAADTALWREHLHAATMIGRHAAAKVAVDLGYAIEADPGPSGRLGHWRIAGIPDEVLELHSKRSTQIDAAVSARGEDSYKARSVAARATRTIKGRDSQDELLARWRAELAEAGWPVERLWQSVVAAAQTRPLLPPLTVTRVRALLGEVLDSEGELGRRKVFARRHLIVALAPHLYGYDTRVLAEVLARALADPEIVPLVAATSAREQVYSLASILAREQAIAASIARQIERTDAPTIDPDTVEAAISESQARIGAPLSDGQRQAAIAICTSGRGAELVVGIAGSGKTTMLKVVTSAYQARGYKVVGTATSGQAARTLGQQADIDESRTLTSLIWRLDHGQLQLSSQTVVILDEAGMTDDKDLIRLAAYVEATRAKLVIVGDHRQLGPVQPGGALGALVDRHPNALHYLGENRRQHTLEERAALEQLRAGSPAKAVDWYAHRGRVHAVADRRDALDAVVAAWAADTAEGHETGLYAWRRANVAELNLRARAWMTDTGRLTGPELQSPGGLTYQAGDQVIALAPNPSAGLVTSQRATIQTVDLANRAVSLRTDQGRLVTLDADRIDPARLGYGYATTVHRTQGATVDHAHLFADSGGRELAYVAMSRAKIENHAWVVADDLDQAIDDLKRDWSTEKRPLWAIDSQSQQALETNNLKLDGVPAAAQAHIYALAAAETSLTAQGFTGIRTTNAEPMDERCAPDRDRERPSASKSRVERHGREAHLLTMRFRRDLDDRYRNTLDGVTSAPESLRQRPRRVRTNQPVETAQPGTQRSVEI